MSLAPIKSTAHGSRAARPGSKAHPLSFARMAGLAKSASKKVGEWIGQVSEGAVRYLWVPGKNAQPKAAPSRVVKPAPVSVTPALRSRNRPRPVPSRRPEGEPERKREAPESDAAVRDDDPRVIAARRLERRRMAAIVLSPAAIDKQAVARAIAFNSDASVEEALAVLESMPAPGADMAAVSARRASRNPTIGVGGLAAPPQQAAASSWDRAFAAVSPRQP